MGISKDFPQILRASFFLMTLDNCSGYWLMFLSYILTGAINLWKPLIRVKLLQICVAIRYFIKLFYSFPTILFNRNLNRGCLVYMFSLRFSGSKFLIKLRRQFRVRKTCSCT